MQVLRGSSHAVTDTMVCALCVLCVCSVCALWTLSPGCKGTALR